MYCVVQANRAHEVVTRYQLARGAGLGDILQDNRYLKERVSLEEKMKKEFALEGLYFLEESYEFTRLYSKMSDKHVCEAVLGIYNKYIRPGSNLEVCLHHAALFGILLCVV